MRERGVVVEEEEQLAASVRAARVAAGGNAAVLRQPQAAHTVRQAHGLPAVADHDDVRVDVLLPKDRLEREPEVVRPVAGRQHDAAERGHRSRSDVRIATRWPSAVIAATGTSTTSSASVSPIASATRTSSVNSIATNAR